jgi:basic membrane lipoprotein Med (substrate-binding protein (PBP1-ABC) superfamily)
MFSQVAVASVASFVAGVVAAVMLKDKVVALFGRAKAKADAVVAAAKS